MALAFACREANLRRVSLISVLVGIAGLTGCETANPEPAHAITADERSSGYVASSRGEVYYAVECDAWRGLSASNRVWFDDKQSAEAARYRASTAPGCSGPSRVAETGTCVVDRIVDGDTIVCSGETLRLLLIDAPEEEQEGLGLRAQLALEELLPPGTQADVEFDVDQRDQYGRLLAYIFLADRTLVNELMARRGYALALVYPPNVRYVDLIRTAVTAARESQVGLWAIGGFECEPRAFRRGEC